MNKKNEQRIDERRDKKYLVVLEVIRVRSAVEQRLKKIRSVENEREESNGCHPILSSFFLLFEECVLYYTLCMYCFAHAFFLSLVLSHMCALSLSPSFVRTITYALLFSRLLRQKRNYTILECVTNNLHFCGCAIALQVF